MNNSKLYSSCGYYIWNLYTTTRCNQSHELYTSCTYNAFFKEQLTDVFAPSNLARKFAMQSDKIYSN